MKYLNGQDFSAKDIVHFDSYTSTVSGIREDVSG